MAVLLILLGVLSLIWAYLSGDAGLTSFMLGQIGAGMFTTGLIVVAFEYFDRKDSEKRGQEQLTQTIQKLAPLLRDTVIEGFAVEPETLAKVASPATLDQVVQNALSVQLGDRQLAHDVYTDLRQQVVRANERWRDVQVSLSLAPWKDGPPVRRGSMFEATVKWEYRVKLNSTVQRLSCVSDLDEYRQLLNDPTSTLVWYFEPVGNLTAAAPEAFELLEFTLNGKKCVVRKGKRARSQTFVVDTASSDAIQGSEVLVSYTFRVLVQQHSHVLQLDFAKPSKGLKVQLAYGDCGIRHVNVLDFIASSEQPRISRTSATAAKPSIELGFDGWVWPKSGVGFCWVLDHELKS